MSDDTPGSVPWIAQAGPQLEAIRRHLVPELFFGGARGGGKSDYLLGDFGQDVAEYGNAWHGILFRKTYPQLEELIARSKAIYPAWFPGAEWTYTNHTWKWPNGSTLKFRHMESEIDGWQEYQGHQYGWIAFDELPQWSIPESWRQLKACLRNGTRAIPNKRMRGTGNPGGVGHAWIKRYFAIDRYPLGSLLIPSETEGGAARMFIRSSVRDNKILLENDPGYIARLKDIGSPALVRQYLDGDWSVTAGAFFPEFDVTRHVVRPFTIPKSWLRYRAMDWGSSAPFSVGWYCIANGEPVEVTGEDGEVKERYFPRGAMIKYREWYGSKGGEDPNVGLQLVAEEVAEGIREREGEGEEIALSVLDPSAFANHNGPSYAERMAKSRVYYQKADNNRRQGWDMLRARLKGNVEGEPMLYFFSTCPDTIRTLPMLQHDRGKKAGAIEDVDTESEDHCFAAGTLVATPDGDVPIELLPECGRVCTRFGVKEYRSAEQIGVSDVVELSFSDGSRVVCTPDHRILSEDGWTEAKDLKGRLLLRSGSQLTVKSFWKSATTVAASIFKGKARDFIAGFGSTTPERFQKGGTSTTWMKIEATTIRKTYDLLKRVSTLPTTATNKIEKCCLSVWSRLVRQRLNGTDRLKDWSGTSGIERPTIREELLKRSVARIVEKAIRLGNRTRLFLSSVIRIAKPVRCVSVERLSGKQPVYCLTVPSVSEFLLADGKIVSNCGDETRYACMARPWVKAGGDIVMPPKFKGTYQTTTTFNDLMEAARRRRMEAA